MKQLEVGDLLIKSQYSTRSVVKIDRVTEKRAFCGTTQFQRDVSGSWVRQIGAERWSRTSYELATPELIDKVRAENKLRANIQKAKDIRFDKLTNDQLERIIAIAEEGI